MSRQADVQRLIANYKRRLQLLKEERALKGLSTPPETMLEIEDIEASLKELQAILDSLADGAEPTRPARVMTEAQIDRDLARPGLSEPAPSQPAGGDIHISGLSGGRLDVGGGLFTAGDVSGDVAGRDKVVEHIDGHKVGRDKITGTPPGPQPSPQEILAAALAQWKQEIEARIEALADLDPDDRETLQKTAAKVEAEAAKGAQADPGKLGKWLNAINALAPGILDVTTRTLQNPLAGVGLVLHKTNDRVNLERRAKT